MTQGLWDFMALLDLNETEVDPIIDHMIQFVNFAQNNRELVFRSGDVSNADLKKKAAYFEPVRQMDVDILWLKTKAINLSSSSWRLCGDTVACTILLSSLALRDKSRLWINTRQLDRRNSQLKAGLNQDRQTLLYVFRDSFDHSLKLETTSRLTMKLIEALQTQHKKL